MFGAAFGAALPLLGKSFTTVATGEGRQSLANNTLNLLTKVPGTGGLRGFLSLSSADQLIHQSTSATARNIGERATTRVTAARDSEGNFITQTEDTAMDYLETTQNERMINVITNIHERAKNNNVTPEAQSIQDGINFTKFSNAVTMDIRKEITTMSKEQQFKAYEEATGTKIKTEEVVGGTKEAPTVVTRAIEPDDLYDVLESNLRTKHFDSGKYQVPPELKHVEDFFVSYRNDATTYGLKGIAGKEARGYNHIKYNVDEILADEVAAVKKFEAMLLADELNKYRIKQGEVTIEDVTAAAQRMVDKALDRDLRNKYVNGASHSQSSSAFRQRKLRMNRELHPEMFVNDIEVVATEYADRVGGRIALKKTYGIDSDASGSINGAIEDVLAQIAKEGREAGASTRAINKDTANARAVLETILGSRKYVKNPNETVQKTARMLKKGASALYGAGFR